MNNIFLSILQQCKPIYTEKINQHPLTKSKNLFHKKTFSSQKIIIFKGFSEISINKLISSVKSSKTIRNKMAWSNYRKGYYIKNLQKLFDLKPLVKSCQNITGRKLFASPLCPELRVYPPGSPGMPEHTDLPVHNNSLELLIPIYDTSQCEFFWRMRDKQLNKMSIPIGSVVLITSSIVYHGLFCSGSGVRRIMKIALTDEMEFSKEFKDFIIQPFKKIGD